MVGRDGERRRTALQAARLYLVVEAEPPSRPLEHLVREALEGGVDIVQLREKNADDGRIVAAGRAVSSICRERGALFFLNDRPDLAAACAADGVHVGQDDAAPADVRRRVGPDVLIGLSTHSAAQIAAAQRSAADYLGVGPVFPTATKPEAAAVGVELVRHAAANARKPFFAIGGIDATNAPAVVAAGARRLAVVRAIRDAAEPARAAAALRAAVEGGESVAEGRTPVGLAG